jgi:hypothetical protein
MEYIYIYISLKGGEKRREKLIFREYVEDVPFV